MSPKFVRELSQKSLIDLKTDLYSMRETLCEKLNYTRFEGEIPIHLVLILHKLLDDKTSEICNKIFASFVESEFFIKLGVYIKTLMTKSS